MSYGVKPTPRKQVETRHDDDGVSVSHREKKTTGRMYIQSMLDELDRGVIDEWVKDMVASGTAADGAYRAVGDLMNQLLAKVKSGAQWHLPHSRYGAKDRAIVKSHPEEITMALRAAIDAARTERDVFEFFHLKYLEPYEREC